MSEKKVYSDGKIEKEIYDALGNEAAFHELYDKPGAVFHNFCQGRENLINWYPFKKDAVVLEIGAGMGALTGYLCQNCKKVVSIEESPDRAMIIQKRCRQYDNLEIISDDIYNYKTDVKFDYILLIGVLEYVGINNDQGNPYISILSKIFDLLNKDGVLLLAIENKFGLKYWCGAPEDHTGVPFEGINNYKSDNITGRYGKSGVRTFSKEELSSMLYQVGFKGMKYYYPLPDYKFPMAVFTDNRPPKDDDIRPIKFYYTEEAELIADERNLYNELSENGTFGFFANSFFIEVSKAGSVKTNIDYISQKRDYDEKYRITTIIRGNKEVKKVASTEKSKEHLKDMMDYSVALDSRGINTVKMSFEDESLKLPFCKETLAIDVFNNYLKSGRISELKNMVKQLEDELRKSSEVVDASNSTIKSDSKNIGDVLVDGFIDMTFINSFYKDETLVFFDQEWKLSNIPIKYILYRAVKYADESTLECRTLKDGLFEEIGIDPQLKEDFVSFENEFLESIMDKTNCSVFDSMSYHEGLTIYPQARKKIVELSSEIEQKNNHITYLDLHIKKLGGAIESKQSEIEQKNTEIQELINRNAEEISKIHEEYNVEIERLNEEKKKEISALIEQKDNEINRVVEEKNAALGQKNAEIAEKDVTINNQKGHIEQLLITDRYYHQIVNSIGWKIVSFPGKVFEALFPQGSNRRQAIRMYVQGFTTYTTKKVLEYDRIDFQKFDNPDVSIVIPVYNQFEYTYNCLKSIKKNSGDVKYEIIIADDVSYDLTRRISKILGNVKVVRNRKNLRFLLNCNNAAKYANGKYILFLNNDTTVNENWLEPLVRLIESDDKIGMVGSKLLYPDGKLQEAGGIVWKDASAWNYGHCQDPESPEFNYVREVDYISGAAIMIRKSLWEEIGGFDEQLVPAYYEDTDLAFEVRKHGYKVMYQPQSEVVHFEGVSNGTDVSTGLKQYQVVNRDKFYEKWKKELSKHKENAQDVFIAKDRSIYKKRILVVDHYVPHHDKDAGGKCTFMYLQLFVKLGMQVTFIGDNFYKHEPYTTELNQMGIEVLYGNYYYNNWQEWLKENAHYFDYIYLQRPHISVKYIDLVKEASDAKIFYFAHDLHHIREMREYELTGDEEKLKASEHWKEIEYDLFSKTDVGHVVGSYEQEIMQKAFPKKAIRNIPLYMYESFPENLQKDFSKRNDLLYVGGFGHPPNVDCVLWFAKEVYPKILEKYPDMVWHVVGGSVPDEIKELNSSNIIIEGFVDDAKLEELYRSCRISIVPLRFGAGVKGKVIEAAYYQIPLVTTSIGAEGLSREEPYMIIEDDPDKYADIVCSLYEDYDKLKQMSDEGKRFIENHFTVKAAENVIRMDMDI